RGVILRRERVRGAERDLRPSGHQRQHEVGRLRGHVEACSDHQALQGLLLLEPLLDEGQHPHLLLGPFDAGPALVDQPEVLHVTVHRSPLASSTQSSARCPPIFGTTIDRISRRSAPAACARASTSWWVEAVPAMLVRHEMASTRIPSATAATASGTVDIPTALAPARARKLDSDGV